MRVAPTDEQEFLREAVAGVVGREAPFTAVRAWAQAGDLRPADAIAARQGWTGIGLEEELDGQGGGIIELAVLAEQLGRGAVPWDLTLAGCVAARLLARAGAGPAAELAAAVARGDGTAALCVDGTKRLAAWDGGVVSADTINLQARSVLGAAGAKTLIVPVEVGDEVTLFAVVADAPGATVTRRTLVDRTRSLADIDLAAAPARPLGTVSRERIQHVANAGAVLVAADALGAAERMLELTTEYVTERRQFGVPVGSFQAVKHAAAEMLVDVEGSRSGVQYAAWAVEADDDDARLYVATAKAFACAAAVRVADKALFLHGAIGYTWEHDLQFPFKRAKSDHYVFGAPDAYLDLIADSLDLAGRTAAPLHSAA